MAPDDAEGFSDRADAPRRAVIGGLPASRGGILSLNGTNLRLGQAVGPLPLGLNLVVGTIGTVFYAAAAVGLLAAEQDAGPPPQRRAGTVGARTRAQAQRSAGGCVREGSSGRTDAP